MPDVVRPHVLPDAMTIQVSQAETLRLPGLAQAGYRWHAEVVGGDPQAVALSVGFTALEGSSRVGAPFADEVLTVVGRRTGRATLRLSQRRPWEPSTATVLEHRMTVTVNEEGTGRDAS